MARTKIYRSADSRQCAHADAGMCLRCRYPLMPSVPGGKYRFSLPIDKDGNVQPPAIQPRGRSGGKRRRKLARLERIDALAESSTRNLISGLALDRNGYPYFQIGVKILMPEEKIA